MSDRTHIRVVSDACDTVTCFIKLDSCGGYDPTPCCPDYISSDGMKITKAKREKMGIAAAKSKHSCKGKSVVWTRKSHRQYFREPRIRPRMEMQE